MRFKPRWTLGGLMVLVALVSLPLAWQSHQVREVDRQRAAADERRAAVVAQIEKLLKGREWLEKKAAPGEMAR